MKPRMRPYRALRAGIVAALFVVVFATPLSGCSGDVEVCQWSGDERPEVLFRLGCRRDFKMLAGQPESSALPASQSVLFLIDRTDGNKIHFFDSEKYLHFAYASENLDGYTDLFAFNAEMYYLEGRRLLLGTLAHHIGPNIWSVEIVPTDKASPDMIRQMYDVVQASIDFDCDLRYHPTSNALEMPSRLPEGVPIVTTAELYQGATYQGMHLGETVGRVKRMKLEELAATYVSRMDIVVLDRVPNDIAAVAGLVTGEFQTPLAHVNLLAEARGTPNMALVGATTTPPSLIRTECGSG